MTAVLTVLLTVASAAQARAQPPFSAALFACQSGSRATLDLGPGSRSGTTLAAWISSALRPAVEGGGGALRVVTGPCEEAQRAFAGAEDDVAVRVMLESPGAQARWQTALRLSPTRLRPRVVTISGRAFPLRPSVLSATLAAVPDDAPLDRGLELITAVALFLGEETAAVAQPAEARRPIGAALERFEEWSGLAEAPAAVALAKQLRALLFIDDPCAGDDEPVVLLREAAHLVPYDAAARGLAAVIRFHQSYHPSSCPAQAERDLIESLALDPTNAESFQRMGVFYELVTNAPPAHTTGPDQAASDRADARLHKFWPGTRPPSPPSLELGLGGGVTESGDSDLIQSAAIGFRADLTYGRDAQGWGVRLSATLPWFRDRAVGSGFASWTRLGVGLGPRYRIRLGGQWYADGWLQPMLAAVYAKGNNFDHNFRALGVDFGGEVGARLGWRKGTYAVWTGLTFGYFAGKKVAGWPSVALRADPMATSSLPAGDLAAVVGVSLFFWR